MSRPTLKSLTAENEALKARIAELEAHIESLPKPVTISAEKFEELKAKATERASQYRENRNKVRAIERSKKPAKPMKIPAKPPILRSIMGGESEFVPPANKTQWMMTYTHTWDTSLKESTRKTYVGDFRGAFHLIGLEAPADTIDPIVLTNWVLQLEHFDIWHLIQKCSEQVLVSNKTKKSSIHSPNARGKALLGVFNAALRAMEDGDPNEKRLCAYTMIAQKFCRFTNDKVTENHSRQAQSEQALANTIEWPAWEEIAEKFIKEHAVNTASFKNFQDGVLIAIYSMMPPTRLQWASVKIANKPPSPGDKDNTIVFFPGGNISVYWGSFKNAKSFREKPVEHKIESPELKVILTSYRQHLVGVNFFPRLNTKKSAQITQSQLGAILGDITQKLTGKRFTVLRMRASYITNYHKQLALEGKTVDINALDKIMFSMLQTDIKTHLGYSKRSQEGWGSVVLNKQSDVIYKETHEEDD